MRQIVAEMNSEPGVAKAIALELIRSDAINLNRTLATDVCLALELNVDAFRKGPFGEPLADATVISRALANAVVRDGDPWLTEVLVAVRDLDIDIELIRAVALKQARENDDRLHNLIRFMVVAVFAVDDPLESCLLMQT